MSWLLLCFTLLYVAFLVLYPFRWAKARKLTPDYSLPDFYVYSYEFHLHTQFSYDSLGKPEDVIASMQAQDIDFVIVTDHDNDTIKNFLSSDRLLAGIERKINGERGEILGDLIEVDGLKVIAHPFKEKYRWKLSRDKNYFVEAIDLKDALLESKFRLFLFLIPALFLYPFLKERALALLRKVIDLENIAERYIKDGWENPVVGGLDHHVKIYIREVGLRFLFPHYRHSFALMRNFLLSDRKVENSKDFIDAVKKNLSVVSFCDKPSFVWVEGKDLYIQTPYENTLVFLQGAQELCFDGSCAFAKLPTGVYVIYSYRYLFKLGRLYLGVSPLFFTAVEVGNGGKTSARGDKTEDTSKGKKQSPCPEGF